MKYKLYTTSQTAWDGMLESINKAKSSIYIEMFIFLDDTKNTHDFVGILKKQAKKGLEVVIIVDAYGSYGLKSEVVRELRQAGVEFLYFSHWLRRTHRKFVIIDKSIAFLGGVNIKNKIRSWHDLQIRVTGKIVKPILKSFARSYQRCGGKNENILKYQKQNFTKKLKSWIIDNWRQSIGTYHINNYYKETILQAKEKVQIVTPYFLPPRWLINQLVSAVNRQVKIEIIIPKNTDVASLNRINYLNACRLASLGVKIFFTSSMNHAKLMLVDNQEGVIGSQNLDILSFGVNVEAGVIFKQKDLVKSIIKIVNIWKNDSKEFDLKKIKPNIKDRLSIIFLKILYPIF